MNVRPSKTLKKVKNFLNKTQSDFEEIDLIEIEDNTEETGVEKSEETDEDSSKAVNKDISEGDEIPDKPVNKLAVPDDTFLSMSSDTKDIEVTENRFSDKIGLENSKKDFTIVNEGDHREAVTYDLDMFSEAIEEGGDMPNNFKVLRQKKGKKKSKKRKGGIPMPQEIAGDAELKKYWGQRYRLFSKFDEGIKMDRGTVACTTISHEDIFLPVLFCTSKSYFVALIEK